MHAFPPAEALGFLLSLRIGQIALDPWSLQFRFEDGGGITVEGKIEHIDENGATILTIVGNAVAERYTCTN